MSRSHRATGGQRGGKRSGAGRKANPNKPAPSGNGRGRPRGPNHRERNTGRPRGGSAPGSHAHDSAAAKAHTKEYFKSLGKEGHQSNAGIADFRKSRGYKRKAARKRQGRAYVVTTARYLEFGTSKMAAKPFMTQAAEQTKSQVLDILTRGIQKALRI